MTRSGTLDARVPVSRDPGDFSQRFLKPSLELERKTGRKEGRFRRDHVTE